MASTVLGKRARAVASAQGKLLPIASTATALPSADYLWQPSRYAKKPYLGRINDENADPEIATGVWDNPQDENESDLDESPGKPKTFSQLRGLAAVSKKTTDIEGRGVDFFTKSRNPTRASSVVSDQETIIQLPTPRTPRHRSVLSKKLPVTPQQRIPPTRKSINPHLPRTPITPSRLPTLYNSARELFARNAKPGRLIGRDSERNELESFVRDGIKSRSGRCIYVSGPPGTGKSALVREVCGDIQEDATVRKAYINCMSAKTSYDIYNRLIGELTEETELSEQCDTMRLQSKLIPRKNSNGPIYVVVLDEIDYLLTLDLEILYKLFEWSMMRLSRLVLIGIANALDLTDRFLPRLKARNLKPRLLPFLPYSASQIASIITSKLRSLASTEETDKIPFIHPAAIQLCAKKVASQTGDIRKAFDMIHRTIDLVESETKQMHQLEFNSHPSPSKSPLSDNPNLSSPLRPRQSAESLASLTPLSAPQATIAHIARVSASSLSNGTSQRLQILNLQQKAALCALISLEKTNRLSRTRPLLATPLKPSSSSIPTARRLYDTYCSLCKRENALQPLKSVDFVDVIGGLETLGLIGKGNGGRLVRGSPLKASGRLDDHQLVSWVAEEELAACLNGPGGAILKGLLAGQE